MAEITEDVEVKVATETAQIFVDSYYNTLNRPGAREHLTEFYVKPTPEVKVDITMNGAVITDPAAFQEIFSKQTNKCYYDVQSYDCQVTNKDYAIGRPQGIVGHASDGRRMSILVTVSGTVKYWNDDALQGELKGFSDTIFLVPNWSTFGARADKRARKWLIQNQTFRIVV